MCFAQCVRERVGEVKLHLYFRLIKLAVFANETLPQKNHALRQFQGYTLGFCLSKTSKNYFDLAYFNLIVSIEYSPLHFLVSHLRLSEQMDETDEGWL